ncbi:MAG: hypothetical protein KDK90_26865 [Leptospiraceae bacterium]|nr:hypothetical protein [Leptospiraceae bacterium]
MKPKIIQIFVVVLYILVFGTLKGEEKKTESNSPEVYQFGNKQFTDKEISEIVYSDYKVPKDFYQENFGRTKGISDSIGYLYEGKYYCTDDHKEAENIFNKHLFKYDAIDKMILIEKTENEKFFEFKTLEERPTYLRGYELFIKLVKDETERQSEIKKFKELFFSIGSINKALIIKFQGDWFIHTFDKSGSFQEQNLGQIHGLENELVKGNPKDWNEFVKKLTSKLGYPLDKSYLRFRVHKCSYLPKYYTFGQRPITKENVKEFVEYFWYSVLSRYNTGGKILDSFVEEDDNSVKYTLLVVNKVSGDFGVYDRIRVFASTWIVYKNSGNFGIYYGNRKNIRGQYNRGPIDWDKQYEKEIMREKQKSNK